MRTAHNAAARRMSAAEAFTARENVAHLPQHAPRELRVFLERRAEILEHVARVAGADSSLLAGVEPKRSACGRWLAVCWFGVHARGSGMYSMEIGSRYATRELAERAAAAMQLRLPGFTLLVAPDAAYFDPASRVEREKAEQLAAQVIGGDQE